MDSPESRTPSSGSTGIVPVMRMPTLLLLVDDLLLLELCSDQPSLPSAEILLFKMTMAHARAMVILNSIPCTMLP